MSVIDSMTEFYVYENMQLLEQLEEILLSGQSDTGELSQDEIEEIFRVMHTIKGSSAMMGYDSLMNLTHSIEDVFDEIRGGRKLSKGKWEEVIDVVLATIDFLKIEISKVQEGLFPQASIDELHKRALNLLKNDSDEIKISIDYENDSNTELIGKNILNIRVLFEEDCKMESLRALSLVMSLEGMYSSIKTIPEDLEGDCDEEIAKNGLSIYLEPSKEISDIEKCIKETMFLKEFEINEVGAGNDSTKNTSEPEVVEETNNTYKQPTVSSDKTKKVVVKNTATEGNKATTDNKAKEKNNTKNVEFKPNQSSNSKNNFISVNISKIDMLMNLVGEIVTTESMVEKLAQSENFNRGNLEKQARRLHQLTTDLQDIVMSIRMVPISSTFTKMQRLVRDMSKKTGKIVELVLIGEQTEVDKTILENISDPLMHMIRNSIDHGVETPEERKKNGKPEKATITLEVKNTGGDVVIVIKDDGRGLNKDCIIKKAIQKGITNKSPEDISDKEAYNFILEPGFSTKESVTEYSGRGVGMDVVHTNIKKLRGSINIDSNIGKGTIIVIRIPLTLAIIDGMKVKIGSEIYIIPSINIKEVFRSGSYEIIKNPRGEEYSTIRGVCYKIYRLSDILEKKMENDNNNDNDNDGIMILVESEIGNICVIVDGIIGQQNLVIKPMPNPLTQFEKMQSHISGCSILEDGSISLIFDVNSIISR